MFVNARLLSDLDNMLFLNRKQNRSGRLELLPVLDAIP
jgi:hypothetical protein